MGFLLNKFTIALIIVLAFAVLLWRINYIKDQLKQAKEDLEIYKEAEVLRKKAYQQYREKTEELEKKMASLREKYNDAEKDETGLIWLESDIPSSVDSSIPY